MVDLPISMSIEAQMDLHKGSLDVPLKIFTVVCSVAKARATERVEEKRP